MRPDEIRERYWRDADKLHPFTESRLARDVCALCASRRRAYQHVEWQWRQERPMTFPELRQ